MPDSTVPGSHLGLTFNALMSSWASRATYKEIAANDGAMISGILSSKSQHTYWGSHVVLTLNDVEFSKSDLHMKDSDLDLYRLRLVCYHILGAGM